MTEATRRVPITVIDKIRRATQDAPECAAKEVTKVQAVRALIPEIQTMQSKGYDWNAIASFLSDQGLAVTAVALKSYLQQAKAAGGRRARRRRSGPGGASRRPSPRQDSGAGGAAGGDARTGAAPAGHAVRAAPPTAAARQAPAELPKANRAAAEVPTQRRSAFVPEEDTDDI